MTESADGGDSEVALHVLEVLDPLIGRFTARNAAQLAVERCGVTLATLEASDVPRLCDKLRPMLRTLLGAARSNAALAEIARPYGEGSAS